MESTVVSAAAPSAVEAVGRTAGRSAGQKPAPAEPVELRPRGTQSDAEFLSSRVAEELPGSMRQTFARFVVDPETHDVSVEILDAGSQEVIRRIPHEDLRQVASRLRASTGFVLDSAV